SVQSANVPKNPSLGISLVASGEFTTRAVALSATVSRGIYDVAEVEYDECDSSAATTCNVVGRNAGPPYRLTLDGAAGA
ncbi:hypothetical protein ABTM91_20985, partial [Acinetobacter baumannii]